MRKVFKFLHLWLGLLSGIVVVVVCLTGGLYAFKDELSAIGEPWRHVEVREAHFLKPSVLLAAAGRMVDGEQPLAITYGQPDEAACIDYAAADGRRTTVYLDPYTAQVLHLSITQPGDFKFFDFLLDGHRRLWLPQPWGQQVVGYGVLLFLVTLITGLVVWYPRRWTRKAVKSHFTLHRPFNARRLVFDLHSVVGFYVLLPLVVASFTGLVFAFGWFSSGVFRLVSGGKPYVAYEMPSTDTTQIAGTPQPLDAVYARLTKEEPHAVQFYYALPQASSDVYRVSIVHAKDSYYKQDNRFFDARTAAELQGNGIYAGKYREKSGAEQLMRMSLDLHEGRVLGLFGRIVMLLASLVGASLPVTGLMLYLRRKQPKGTGPLKSV